MDAERFTPAKTGAPVATTIGQAGWAFIPQRLPRNWTISIELWPLLARAKESLARLDGIGRTLPDPELLLRPLNNREAIRSSSLEGTYASPQELLLFELAPEVPSSSNDRRNDWREVFNYAESMRRGTELLEELPLSLRVIQEMHRTLLTGVRGRERAPGEFRRMQVHIGADARYVSPPANEIERCLDDFEKFLNDADAIEPLVRTFIAHYQFEAIHPFFDGNGRVGRALLSLCAYRWCELWRPWLYMSPFFDTHKEEYIDRLFAISTHGAWSPWLEFCLRGVIDVCADAISRCDRLRSVRDDYHRRADGLNGRMHRLVEMVFSFPIIRTADAARRLGVTYPTAKTDIAQLVDLRILSELAGAYPKAYIARRVFDAAYDESWSAEDVS